MSERVQLNVGGTHFETTKQTLMGTPYFAALLLRWNSEEIFMDRSGKAFEHVLNLLRNPEYIIPLRYQSELQFYGIDIPKTPLGKVSCHKRLIYSKRSPLQIKLPQKVFDQLKSEGGFQATNGIRIEYNQYESSFCDDILKINYPEVTVSWHSRSEKDHMAKGNRQFMAERERINVALQSWLQSTVEYVTLKNPLYELQIKMSSSLYHYFKFIHLGHYQSNVNGREMTLIDMWDEFGDYGEGHFNKDEVMIDRAVLYPMGTRMTHLKEKHVKIIEDVLQNLLSDYQSEQWETVS